VRTGTSPTSSVLVDSYEPDDFRKEELSNFFAGDEAKVAAVLARAREMGGRYRALVAELRTNVYGEVAREEIARGRAALDEGDADRALQILRLVVLAPETPPPLRSEAERLVASAIRPYPRLGPGVRG
jgi:hypothetical protein